MARLDFIIYLFNSISTTYIHTLFHLTSNSHLLESRSHDLRCRRRFENEKDLCAQFQITFKCRNNFHANFSLSPHPLSALPFTHPDAEYSVSWMDHFSTTLGFFLSFGYIFFCLSWITKELPVYTDPSLFYAYACLFKYPTCVRWMWIAIRSENC